MKSASRLLPDGWVGLKSSGYRCHFRAFQLKLFILDTRNFGNGSVVQKLQLFEVARISEFFGRPEKNINLTKPLATCCEPVTCYRLSYSVTVADEPVMTMDRTIHKRSMFAILKTRYNTL